MKRQHVLFAISSLLLSSLPALAAGGGTGTDRMLNNEGLVVLAHAGYNERFLVELIQAQANRFDTSVEGLVYLAKQGISEKVVRLIISEQKAAERRAAERAAAGDEDEPMKAPEPAKTPVRLKVVKQRVLVAATPASKDGLGANPMIVVEKRMFGDRYYAMPGAQAAPVATQAATPRAPQSMAKAPAAAPTTTQVAVFR